MTYESSIFNGLKVMANVKIFVHAADANNGYDISSPDICPGSLKRQMDKALLP